MRKILTVAGYDPSSGAGITKDLEVFLSFGAHGISVPTCIVMQGPQGVQDAFPMPYPQFCEMIDMAREQLPIAGAKVGAVWNEAYVNKFASFLDRIGGIPLVIDPIIAAKNGTRLVTDKGLQQMIQLLFPKADAITPNIDEASAITGRKISNLKDMKSCAKRLFEKGPKSVIIKGGHLKGEPLDLFYDGDEFLTLSRQRIDRTVHGTGCVFSSLMISFLAQGYDARESFLTSGKIMGELLGASYRIDRDGYFYTSPGIMKSVLSERWTIIETLKEAGKILKRDNLVGLIPEVQLDVGYAIKNARGVEDVAAFPGRIGCHQGQVYIKGDPEFGASSHTAKLILACMRHYPHLRSCANVRYDSAIIEKALKNNLKLVFVDRKKRSKKVSSREEGSVDFLVDEALGRTNYPPDIIYDSGDVGKEPIVGLFARDPIEITKKMEIIRL